VPLKVMMRSYRGDEVTRQIPIEIPSNAGGPLTVLGAAGPRPALGQPRAARQLQEAKGVTQIVRAFNKARKNNRVYVRLLSPDAGAVVSGEPLPALPPSVLAVLDGDRSGGQVSSLRNATLGEWEFPADYAVSGARFLSVTVDDH
jgi:hypothetical protein